MLFSKLVLAILPALALAGDAQSEETTTVTSTTKITKTIFLAEHTVTSEVVEITTKAHNSTTPAATPSASKTKTTPVNMPTSGSTGSETKPSTVNGNSAAGLRAGGLFVVGAAGMAALALL